MVGSLSKELASVALIFTTVVPNGNSAGPSRVIKELESRMSIAAAPDSVRTSTAAPVAVVAMTSIDVVVKVRIGFVVS